MEVSLDVDVQASREGIFVYHQQECVVDYAGVVDQNVKSAESLVSLAEHVLNFLEVGGVRLNCNRLLTERFYRGDYLLRLSLVRVVIHYYIVAAFRQAKRARLAYSAGSAGYQCYLFHLSSLKTIRNPGSVRPFLCTGFRCLRSAATP